MRFSTVRRYVSLFDTLLVGHWTPPSTASGATEMFRQWRTRTRNRPLPPQHGSTMAFTCLRDGDVSAAMTIVFAQEDAAPLLGHLSHSLSESISSFPLDTCELVLQALSPIVENVSGKALHAEYLSVVLPYAGRVLREAPTDGALSTSQQEAERIIDAALRLALASPAQAALLLAPIAGAAPPSMLDRVILVVDTVFRGRHQYIDVSGLRAVLRALAHRQEFDHQVWLWWRWMQHTQLSLEPEVLSVMVEVLSRAHKTMEAAEVVHQLQALNGVPSPGAQLLYLHHLAGLQRPPVPQAELLVSLWSHHEPKDDGHAAALQWALLQFYYKADSGKHIRRVSTTILRNYASSLAEGKLEELLQRIVNDTASKVGDDVELERSAVSVLLERFAPRNPQLVFTAALLADRAVCVEKLGPWLSACDNDVFEESLSLVASRSNKLALELCEVSDRVVPDTLLAWSQLLGDDHQTEPLPR